MWKLANKYFLLVYFIIGLIFFTFGLVTPTNNNPSKKIEFTTNNSRNISRNHAFLFIIRNNFSIAVMVFLGGFISFVFIPSILISYNAYNLGYLIAMLNYKFFNPESAILHLILPHAILEIIAFYWIAHIGTKNFKFIKTIIYDSIIDFNNISNIKNIQIPVLLLLIAGFIEAYITNY
jgi:uncharacterized membrane protein SpoIIM required for sporulation